MATVSGPPVARHPSPAFRKVHKISRPSAHGAAPPPASDPYHGHEAVAKLCARFVSHLFACPDIPPPPAAPSNTPTPRLEHFIAYALHRTRLHTSVTFAALYLLQRLKARFPAAKGSSGHRLFISAFMIASKIICDDTYSNKSWCIVGQGMFALREINQMEREMCSYLEWQLNVEPTTLHDFEVQVRRDFAGPGPYPPITLPSPTPSPFSHPGAAAASVSTSIPSFGHHRASPSQPSIIPNPTITYPSPTSPPDTPEASHSASTSPASSASPSTPPDSIYAEPRVASGSAESSPTSTTAEGLISGGPSIPMHKPTAKAVTPPPVVAPPPSVQYHQKSKASREQFAFATRTVW